MHRVIDQGFARRHRVKLILVSTISSNISVTTIISRSRLGYKKIILRNSSETHLSFIIDPTVIWFKICRFDVLGSNGLNRLCQNLKCSIRECKFLNLIPIATNKINDNRWRCTIWVPNYVHFTVLYIAGYRNKSSFFPSIRDAQFLRRSSKRYIWTVNISFQVNLGSVFVISHF